MTVKSAALRQLSDLNPTPSRAITRRSTELAREFGKFSVYSKARAAIRRPYHFLAVSNG